MADLVILERNPLTVDPATIKDIAVLETIKEGRSIYRRPAGVTAASQVRAWPAHSHVPAAEPLTPVARDTLALLLQAAR